MVTVVTARFSVEKALHYRHLVGILHSPGHRNRRSSSPLLGGGLIIIIQAQSPVESSKALLVVSLAVSQR
jgi:hypothetical protein